MNSTAARRRFVAYLALSALLLAVGASARAATIVVSNANDSGAGSLRNAIVLANAQPGSDEIQFDLPSSPTTITLTSALPNIASDVLINATTQPGYAGAPLVMLSPSTFSASGIGLHAVGSNVTIRGLAVSNFGQYGIDIDSGADNCVVEGCFIGVDLTGSHLPAHPGATGVFVSLAHGCRIGSDQPGLGNVIMGANRCITVSGASGNAFIGNKIGVSAAGNSRLNPAANSVLGMWITSNSTENIVRLSTLGGLGNGVQIDAGSTTNTLQGNLIGVTSDARTGLPIGTYGIVNYASGGKFGGVLAGQGNVFGGCPYALLLWGGLGCSIQGNVFGLGADQAISIPNQFGIYLAGTATLPIQRTLIGGSTPLAGNVIANCVVPITCEGSLSSFNTIQGNLIGINRYGRVFGNSGNGMNFSGATTDNVVGGTQAGAGNVVTATGGRGVQAKYHLVDNDEYPRRIAILGNLLYGNLRGGIDLLGSHTQTNQSPNDAGDLDDGPNGMQNYPVLTGYARSPQGDHLISGGLDSLPNKTYLVEIYANEKLNPVNLADAEKFATRFYATTGADGKTTFTQAVPFRGLQYIGGDLPLGRYLTATATDPEGNTSEISPQFDTAPQGIHSLTVSDIPSTATLKSGGPITLRWKNTASGTSDTLKFTLSDGTGLLVTLATIVYDANGAPTVASLARVGADGRTTLAAKLLEGIPSIQIGADGWSTLTVTLPGGLPSGRDYSILGESLHNPGIADWTANFSLTNPPSGARGWREYR